MNVSLTAPARFARAVILTGDGGCWGWSKSRTSRGYGKFAFQSGDWTLAHRASYMLFVGPIPDGLFVCHRCDNTSCTNPDHLFLGTCAENNQDMADKGRRANGPALPHAKLSDEKVREIRASRVGYDRLARQYGVSKRLIQNVVLRRTWKHVK